MGLKVNNLYFSYSDKSILEDISFEVKKGEIMGIIGPNGAGKSTLMKCINKINNLDSGQVILSNKRIDNLKEKELAHYLSYVPQSIDSRFPVTVVDMVMMGRLPFVDFCIREVDKTKVFSLLKEMELDLLAFKSIDKLSGGERQRVYIARAIAQEPQLILLDEPTSSLDIKYQIGILNLLRKIVKEGNIACMLTIHDLNLASMFCDKILMLKNKKVFGVGPVDSVLTEENIYSIYGVNSHIDSDKGYSSVRISKEELW